MAQDVMNEKEKYVQITGNSLEVVGKKFVELLNTNYGKYVNNKYLSFKAKYVAEYIVTLSSSLVGVCKSHLTECPLIQK